MNRVNSVPASSRAIIIVDKNGQENSCVELCDDCPRRKGTALVKAAGIKGLLGAKVEVVVHDRPITTGKITGYVTNGLHGLFTGEDGTNTGTVNFLNGEELDGRIKDIVNCNGPDKANNCEALGQRSLESMIHLDRSMEAGPTIVLEPRVIVIP